jgi:alpha-N-arabinofuranosidase
VVVQKPGLDAKASRPTGNFYWKDDFDAPTPGFAWNMLRTPDTVWWQLQDGKLQLQPMHRSVYEKTNPAFLGRRQQHTTFEVSTEMVFEPGSDKAFAGLVLFQNDENNIMIGKCTKNGNAFVQVVNRKYGATQVLQEIALEPADARLPIRLTMEVDKGSCNLYFSIANEKKTAAATSVDITHLSTRKAKGFVGSYVGLYATSMAN